MTSQLLSVFAESFDLDAVEGVCCTGGIEVFDVTDRRGQYDVEATVKGGGDDVVWSFNATPDRPPTIALAKDPEGQARGVARVAEQQGAAITNTNVPNPAGGG